MKKQPIGGNCLKRGVWTVCRLKGGLGKKKSGGVDTPMHIMDVKIGFSMFCTLHPKWCIMADSSGSHSICVCTTPQNTILLVDALNWEVIYKDLVNK